MGSAYGILKQELEMCSNLIPGTFCFDFDENVISQQPILIVGCHCVEWDIGFPRFKQFKRAKTYSQAYKKACCLIHITEITLLVILRQPAIVPRSTCLTLISFAIHFKLHFNLVPVNKSIINFYLRYTWGLAKKPKTFKDVLHSRKRNIFS